MKALQNYEVIIPRLKDRLEEYQKALACTMSMVKELHEKVAQKLGEKDTDLRERLEILSWITHLQSEISGLAFLIDTTENQIFFLTSVKEWETK
jgi:hypothetical protein